MAGDAVQASAAAAGAPSPWLAGALALGALAVLVPQRRSAQGREG